MSSNSPIEWTGTTWNPVTGCTKVSPGCRHCYAERMALRLQAIGQANYANGFRLTLQRRMLDLPLRWRKPRTIFSCSMSDLFHEEVPLDYILEVFSVINRADWHLFQLLTKRAERLAELSPRLPWQPHIWMGVTVENTDYTHRIDCLRACGAAVKYLSIEPLLGPIPSLDLTGIDWVIVGGESGPAARPMRPEWAIGIRDQCVAAQVPFYFKQWGGANKAQAGRMLEGRLWSEIPRRSGATGLFATT